MAGKALLKQGEDRRKAILKFLRTYIKKNGMAPTIQEVADGVGLVSPNATRNHLRQLEKDGYLKMTPRIARAIVLIDPPPEPKPKVAVVKPARARKVKSTEEKVSA